jgi:hypothetical protein
MGTTAGRILKSDDVKLEGQFHLDLMKAASNLPHPAAAVLTEPKVRIVENNPEFAVIEITCSCGNAMQLRCEYAGADSAENPQKQDVK